MPRRLVLGFLLVWSATLFLSELREATGLYDRRTLRFDPPASWRFGTPQVETLERCFAEARSLIPAGSVVIFLSAGPEVSQFFAWRWAAYEMPDHHVLQVASPRAVETARYLISHEVPLEHPRAVPIKALTGCQLFRIRPL